MNITEAFKAVVEATTDDPTGHLPNCGYTDEHQTCGCAAWGERLYDALARLLDAAWNEGWDARNEDYWSGDRSPYRGGSDD